MGNGAHCSHFLLCIVLPFVKSFYSSIDQLQIVKPSKNSFIESPFNIHVDAILRADNDSVDTFLRIRHELVLRIHLNGVVVEVDRIFQPISVHCSKEGPSNLRVEMCHRNMCMSTSDQVPIHITSQRPHWSTFMVRQLSENEVFRMVMGGVTPVKKIIVDPTGDDVTLMIQYIPHFNPIALCFFVNGNLLLPDSNGTLGSNFKDTCHVMTNDRYFRLEILEGMASALVIDTTQSVSLMRTDFILMGSAVSSQPFPAFGLASKPSMPSAWRTGVVGVTAPPQTIAVDGQQGLPGPLPLRLVVLADDALSFGFFPLAQHLASWIARSTLFSVDVIRCRPHAVTMSTVSCDYANNDNRSSLQCRVSGPWRNLLEGDCGFPFHGGEAQSLSTQHRRHHRCYHGVLQHLAGADLIVAVDPHVVRPVEEDAWLGDWADSFDREEEEEAAAGTGSRVSSRLLLQKLTTTSLCPRSSMETLAPTVVVYMSEWRAAALPFGAQVDAVVVRRTSYCLQAKYN